MAEESSRRVMLAEYLVLEMLNDAGALSPRALETEGARSIRWALQRLYASGEVYTTNHLKVRRVQDAKTEQEENLARFQKLVDAGLIDEDGNVLIQSEQHLGGPDGAS